MGSVLVCLLLAAACGLLLVAGFAPAARRHCPARFRVESSREGVHSDVVLSEAFQAFLLEVGSSMKRETFISVALSKPAVAPAPASASTLAAPPALRSIVGRVVSLKAGLRLQLNHQYTTNEQVKNFELGPTSVSQISALIAAHGFRKAKLTTASKVFELSINHAGSSARLAETEAQAEVPPLSSLSHDRQKLRPVDPRSPFLRALRVTTDSGRPLTGMADKLRQIERFIEILAGLVAASPALSAPLAGQGQGQGQAPLRIVDMGSGLAYLTFAAHAYFQQARASRGGAETVGVEARPALVAQSSAVARGLGPDFAGLSFAQGCIDEFFPVSAPAVAGATAADEAGPRTRKKKPLSLSPVPPLSADSERASPLSRGVDVLLALHACDVATDQAIFSGVSHGAEVIVTSPCCHKEIRRQMDQRSGGSGGGADAQGLGLNSLLEHGLFRERTAEMVTDTLRALCLDWAGYDSKVLEFVDGQHTAKNVMIAATRRKQADEGEGEVEVGGRGVSEAEAERRAGIERRLGELMRAVGVQRQSLVELLGIPVVHS